MPEHSVEIANAVKDPAIEPIIVRGAEIMGRLAILLGSDETRCQAMMDEFKGHVAVRV